MSNDAPRFTYPLPRTDATQPPEEYKDFRAKCPVPHVNLPTGARAYLATRYDDVKTVLADPRFSRAAFLEPGAPRLQPVDPHPDNIMSMDPPRLSRVRRLIAKEFGPRRVESLRPHIEAVTAQLLDEIEASERPVDMVSAFATPLPLQIVCELIGVPFEDRAKFQGWSDRFTALTKYSAQEIMTADRELREYLAGLIEGKRRVPGADLLSALANESDPQVRLTHSEMVMLGVFLLIAGHDTTTTVIATSIVTLLRNPEQLRLWREKPQLTDAAVDELIRYNTPGDGSFARIALEDVELSGTTVPAGSAVIAPMSSANRDPSVFADPDTFDITRDASAHVGFGYGPHFCIGHALARLEMKIALDALFTRLPDLRLAVAPEELRWRQFAALGGLHELPVTW
ncbi:MULTISPECIES: cytochrome P450 [unclassified Streptomyces]|uniref:cytochrome P450 n=1 Tax=unclassified Streptomyces TaxID=2593676 RepID=UPI002E2AD186|nr:cytochrome P450 [Streptomyces sp. NBC_00223]